MTRIHTVSPLYYFAPAVLLTLLVFLVQTGHSNEMTDNLAVRVASIELGMNGYNIGKKLTSMQKEIASDNISKDSYKGTYKFKDNDLFIIAAKNDDTILAVFQRNDKADRDQTKLMISGLMLQYGEPTTMAHDKLIYWAYNDAGKISEETYNKFRADNETVEVLATVKFNSSFEITGEDPAQEEEATNYFIISSDLLTQEFIARNK
jgi:hypothetical protein